MPHYAKWDRAPYHPYECVICTHEASPDNFLVEAGRVIEDYGDVYVCKSCIFSLANFAGVVESVAAPLLNKIEVLEKETKEIPQIIERLVNGIRDISISTSADLLAIGTGNILVNDQKLEQSDSSVDENELGDNSTSESSSESVVDKGSDSVPASSSRKRTANTNTRTSTVSNG